MANLLEYCQGLPRRHFAAGDTLLAQGTTAGVLYILAEGAVEVVKGDVQITTVSEPGALFGEISVLLAVPHVATVRALRDSWFHVADDPMGFLRSHPDIAFEVARLLSRRLQMVTGYLVDLKHQFADKDDHFAMVDEVLESLVHHQSAEAEPGCRGGRRRARYCGDRRRSVKELSRALLNPKAWMGGDRVVYARRVPAETTPDEKAWMDDVKIVARERDRGTAR